MPSKPLINIRSKLGTPALLRDYYNQVNVFEILPVCLCFKEILKQTIPFAQLSVSRSNIVSEILIYLRAALIKQCLLSKYKQSIDLGRLRSHSYLLIIIYANKLLHELFSQAYCIRYCQFRAINILVFK